jgi:hypothetical protein
MKILALTFLLLVAIPAHSQDESDRRTPLSKKLETKMLAKMPNWRYRSITPIEGSKNVTIDIWEVGDLAVRIAVTEYENNEQASSATAHFEKRLRLQEASSRVRGQKLTLLREEPSTECDRYFLTNVDGSEQVVLQRGNLRVFVNVVRPARNTDKFLARDFARHVLEVLASE